MNKYQDFQLIQKDLYGQLFKATDTTINKPVCIKKNQIQSSEKNQQQILQEFEPLKSLKHQNIVEYNEFYFEKDFICIVTEYLEGTTLRSFIDSQQNSPSELFILSIFEQIVSALRYAYRMKILHKCLNPDIIFLNSDGKIKICDFFIWKIIELSDDKIFSEYDGYCYKAPEEFYFYPDDSCSSDVWSLGFIIYELMTFKFPFDQTKLNNLIYIIMNEKPMNIEGHFSFQLTEIVMKMLEKDPKKELHWMKFSNIFL